MPKASRHSAAGANDDVPGTGASPGPAPSATAAGKTIVVCDDESSLRELVRAVLGPRYTYLEAADGLEALELVRAAAPDLLVLDLMLPQTTGFDVLERLRGDPEASGTRVLVLTAWSHLEQAARAAGADRFVVKPFEPDDLETAVQELLRPQ